MSKTNNYTVAVGKIVTRMVVTVPPPASVAAGVEFTFAGHLEDVSGNRLHNKTHTLNVDGQDVGSGVTNIGAWAWNITINTPGSHVIYVKFPGDATYEGC